MSTMKYVRHKTWTLNEIEVLIWYHRRPEPHPRRTTAAVLDVTYKFLRLGLIERVADSYTTTAKGQEVLEAMKRVPLPSDKPATPCPAATAASDPYALLQEVTEALSLVTFHTRYRHPDVETVDRLNDLLDRARTAVDVHKGAPLPVKEGETE